MKGCEDSIGLLGARHLLPGCKRLGANGTIVGSGHPMTAGAKQIVNGAMDGEKALGVAWGLEPTHRSLPLPGRRVGQLGAVIQPFVRAVLDDAGNQFLASRFVAFKRVGDDHPWHVAQALEELAQ